MKSSVNQTSKSATDAYEAFLIFHRPKVRQIYSDSNPNGATSIILKIITTTFNIAAVL